LPRQGDWQPAHRRLRRPCREMVKQLGLRAGHSPASAGGSRRAYLAPRAASEIYERLGTHRAPLRFGGSHASRHTVTSIAWAHVYGVLHGSVTDWAGRPLRRSAFGRFNGMLERGVPSATSAVRGRLPLRGPPTTTLLRPCRRPRKRSWLPGEPVAWQLTLHSLRLSAHSNRVRWVASRLRPQAGGINKCDDTLH
jgi:hypothetical protein